MCAAASARAITSRPRASSPSFAQCPCVLTRVGTKFSSIFRTSRDVHMVPTISKLCVCKSTLTVAFDASISRTAFIPKRSFHPSSNYSCPCKNNNLNKHTLIHAHYSEHKHMHLLTYLRLPRVHSNTSALTYSLFLSIPYTTHRTSHFNTHIFIV